MPTRPEPRILRVLDLSTAHLPVYLSASLHEQEGVIAYPLKYGYLLWVPPTDEDDEVTEWRMASVPEEIQAILRYAQHHRCDYVLLDGGADTVDDLPTWEW